MGPKECMENYNVDIAGRTQIVVTRREHNSGDKYMEEIGEVLTTHIDVGGMEVDTPDDATYFRSITFNGNITEMEYSMNRKTRRHKISSY